MEKVELTPMGGLAPITMLRAKRVIGKGVVIGAAHCTIRPLERWVEHMFHAAALHSVTGRPKQPEVATMP